MVVFDSLKPPSLPLIRTGCNMAEMHDRNRIIRLASYIGIGGNCALALLKIVAGLMAGSLAVLGDGLDSLGDVAFSLMTLWVAVVIAMPADAEHPYGHSRAETIGTSLLAFGMFFIGAQLALSSVHLMLESAKLSLPEPLAVYVTLISIGGKLGLSLNQQALGRRSGSQMLLANAVNMRNDLLTSAGVLLGLALGYVLRLPLLDKLVALALSFWIMLSAVRIYLDTMHELMDGVRDEGIYDQIFQVLKAGFGDINPHRVRVRKLGAYYAIDLDIELDGNLNLNAAHAMASRVEAALTSSIANIYDIMVHVEPRGNVQLRECYGRREDED